jgi:YVTN family beta-propeller protein
MKNFLLIRKLILIVACVMFCSIVNKADARPLAFITNSNDNSLSIIDLSLIDTDPKGAVKTLAGIREITDDDGKVVSEEKILNQPWAVNRDLTGKFVAITNISRNTNESNLVILDSAEDFFSDSVETLWDVNIIAELDAGEEPTSVAFDNSGTYIYVVNKTSDTLTVIDARFYDVIATVSLEYSEDTDGATNGDVTDTNNNDTDTNNNDTDTGNDGDDGNDGLNDGDDGLSISKQQEASSKALAPLSVVTHPFRPFIYVTNSFNNSVSVVKNNNQVFTVVDQIRAGKGPYGLAINPSGSRLYVADFHANKITVIDTYERKVIAKIDVGQSPYGVAVHPTGERVFVTNSRDNTVSVIDVFDNIVIDSIEVGLRPVGISLTGAGDKALVVNSYDDTVSIIDLVTYEVITVEVGDISSSPLPISFGNFITPGPDAVNNVSFLTPRKRIFIESGSEFTVKWQALPYMKYFTLSYSFNGGRTWKVIERKILNTSIDWPLLLCNEDTINYNWTVPIVRKNKNEGLLKIEGFDSLGFPASDKATLSGSSFIVGVAQFTNPVRGMLVTSGRPFKVTWETYDIQDVVEKVNLFVQKKRNGKWIYLATRAGNPGSFTWIPPHVERIKDEWKFKLIFKNKKNRIVGIAKSDTFFVGPDK